MTDNSAKVTETPATAQIDVQDPLPETDWFWRRCYTFLFTLLSVAFIWFGMEALASLKDGDRIYRVTRYMIGVHVMLVTYYMVAPSAEQIVKIIQSARLLKAGIPISRSAVVQTPETRTEVKTIAGHPQDREEPPLIPPTQSGSGQRPDDDFAPRSRA